MDCSKGTNGSRKAQDLEQSGKELQTRSSENPEKGERARALRKNMDIQQKREEIDGAEKLVELEKRAMKLECGC